MNLYELMAHFPTTDLADCALPAYLLGSFRRKSISFFNGQTDESTIVYWFQSKSFSIDLRLSHGQATPIRQRQGWIGDTLWDANAELLSWQIEHSYQLHVQWPEPAALFHVGNCVLEFAPSKAYVEDWRQQSSRGCLLGLRLYAMQQQGSADKIPMQGGLIIAGEHMAYVQSRHPTAQATLAPYARLDAVPIADAHDINSYEVSVALHGACIHYSTQDARIGQNIDLNQFFINANGQLCQHKQINGRCYCLYYDLDVYVPQYEFKLSSSTSPAAVQWFNQEAEHLQCQAKSIR